MLAAKKVKVLDALIQEIVDSNFNFYKRITDDRAFEEAIKNFLLDQYLRAHRNAIYSPGATAATSSGTTAKTACC